MFLISTLWATDKKWIYIAGSHSDLSYLSGSKILLVKILKAVQRNVMTSFINKLQIDHSIVRHSPIFSSLTYL